MDFFNQLSSMDWALLYLAGLFVGFAKTGVSGVGILAVPIFAIVFPANQSAGILLPVLCFADIFAVSYYRRHCEWKHIWGLMPWVGIGLLSATGIYFWGRQEGSLLSQFIETGLKPTMGVIVLFVLFLAEWNKNHKDVPKGKLVPVGTGIAAGFTSMLANAAGPIMAIYLLVMKLPKQAFIGTKAWFFLIINFVKIPLMMIGANSITRDSLSFNAKLIPAVMIGALLGVRVVKFIPEEKFKIAIKVLVIAACIKLIFS